MPNKGKRLDFEFENLVLLLLALDDDHGSLVQHLFKDEQSPHSAVQKASTKRELESRVIQETQL